MRNYKNAIPVPTKPVKSIPKSLPRPSVQRKSISCQTERVILVKEENLSFYSCTRFGHNDGGMRRDYLKAINYINSCHKFINSIIEKRNESKSDVFLLPVVTNYIPIFSHLIGKKSKPKEIVVGKDKERKNKSNFGVTLTENAPIDPIPGNDLDMVYVNPHIYTFAVGDYGRNLENEIDPSQMAEIVRDQIQQFLSALETDMNKATRRTKSETAKQTCKQVDIVKRRLEELSRICSLKKQISQRPVTPTKPPTPPPMSPTEIRRIILSDKNQKIPKLKTVVKSASSLTSASSDIKTDSDLEIND